MNYKFKLSRRLATSWTGGLVRSGHVMSTSLLAAYLFGACVPTDTTPPDQLVVTPETALIRPGLTQQFTSSVLQSDGTTSSVWAVFNATGGIITPTGLYTAGPTPGTYQVSARTPEGLVGTSAITIDSGIQPVVQIPQWTIQDDGHFVNVEGTVLHVKFAYGGAADGWFRGGGGRDGGIVELYYKPTSPTRNLIFRNGAWGGGRDDMDFFQAETLSVDQADFTTPDFVSGMDATLNSHRTWESAGRLFAEFDFQFQAWRIVRTYILYPWGDLTVHAQVTLTNPGRWNYLAHTLQFAVSPYTIVNGSTFSWGGNYQNDGESFHAWSDGYGINGGSTGTGYYEYNQIITQGLDRNSAIWDFGRSDQYSGFMIDDRNGNDPDILVVNGDSTTSYSPVDQVARAVGGRAYVETGIFSPAYTNPTRTYAGTNWFYSTVPPCCPPVYNSPMYWPASLGTWEEVFHVLLRRNLKSSDYLPVWESRARKLGQEAPRLLVGAQTTQLNSFDRLHHVIADPGADTVRFQWTPASASATLNNYNAFVVEQFDPSRVSVEAQNGSIKAYYSAAAHLTLVLLSAPQTGPFTVTLSRP